MQGIIYKIVILEEPVNKGFFFVCKKGKSSLLKYVMMDIGIL